jgi:hypothetical protein
MHWRVFFASATGKHHLDSDAPCQDAGHHLVVDGTFVGVVCDGAGSAAEGQAGADFFSRTVAGLLAEELPAAIGGALAPADRPGGSAPAGPNALRAELLAVLGQARERLARIAGERGLGLRDFACTLVGCVVGRAGGCFFHIGDGFGVFTRQDGCSVVSLPENGEYSDETFFVTDEGWEDHLRITPLAGVGQGSMIGLMTDGASPFAIDRTRTGFFRPFIDPVVKFLRNAADPDGNRALQGVLEDEKTFAITADDKTLLLALAG